MLGFIFSLLRRSDPAAPGPAEIIRARRELAEPDRPQEATIGRPRLDDSGKYGQTPKAVIPVTTTDPTTSPAPLVFDVDGDRLADFCERLTDDPDGIEYVEGLTVPLRWVNGTPIPNWKEADTRIMEAE